MHLHRGSVGPRRPAPRAGRAAPRRILTLLAGAVLATGLLTSGGITSGSAAGASGGSGTSTTPLTGAGERAPGEARNPWFAPLTAVPGGFWCLQPRGYVGPVTCDGSDEPFPTTGAMRHRFIGMGTGPSSATYGGRAVIDHFHGSDSAGWARVVTMSDPGDPGLAAPADADQFDLSPHPTTGDPSTWRGQGYTLDPHCGSWWSPICWKWSEILGTVFDWVGACLTGAADGVISTAIGQIVVNLITRGAAIVMDPWGYVALAIGNCLINVIHR